MRGLIVYSSLVLAALACETAPPRPQPAVALVRGTVDTPPARDRAGVPESLTDPWRPWPPGEMPVLPRAATGAPVELLGPMVLIYLAEPEDTTDANLALRARYRALAARGPALAAALAAANLNVAVVRTRHVAVRDPRWAGTTVYALGDSLAHVWLFAPGGPPVEADVRGSSAELIEALRRLARPGSPSRAV